jgi:hypothetical protein
MSRAKEEAGKARESMSSGDSSDAATRREVPVGSDGTPRDFA